MNLPNKLTLTRIILVPFFLFALLYTPLSGHFIWAILIFALASLTDFLDGKIARQTKAVTDFGKFADPLADKLLVMSAFIAFVQLGIVDAVCVIIILARELAVTSLRLVAAAKGTVIAANIWGKLKTVSQMITILFILSVQAIKEACSVNTAVLDICSKVLILISVALTIISGVIYIYQNRNVIKQM